MEEEEWDSFTRGLDLALPKGREDFGFWSRVGELSSSTRRPQRAAMSLGNHWVAALSQILRINPVRLLGVGIPLGSAPNREPRRIGQSDS